jgi:glucokinase
MREKIVTAAVADIGGTQIKLALVSNNKIVAEAVCGSDASLGLKPKLSVIGEGFCAMLRESKLSLTDCAAIGFGFPGVVDPRRKKVIATYGKFDDAPSLDLSSWANTEFGLPFVIESDARAALQGERVAGAGKDCADLVMITLGTGIGSAAVVQGQMLYGAHLQAGILGGHSTIRAGGPKCSCGNFGCAEALASSSVLNLRYREHRLCRSSALSECGLITYQDVFRLASVGDQCAAELKAEAIDVWAAAIVNLIRAYDPERVIVGGGIMNGAHAFFEELVEQVHASSHAPRSRIEIAPAQLGTRAGVIGMANFAENARGNP